MIIGIDYRLANSSHRGMARYCREITKSILGFDTQNEFILFINNPPREEIYNRNVRFHSLNCSNYIISEQILLPIAIKKEKCEVFWSPYNTFPIFLPKSVKLLVTIHDLIFFYKSSSRASIYQYIGSKYRKFLLKYFSRRIECCFTVSKFSKNEIIRVLGLKAPIHITYNCGGSLRSKIENLKINTTVKKKDYFFTLSGDAPSKNLNTIISIFNSKFPNEKLIIGGVSKKSPIRNFTSNNIKFLEEGISDEKLIMYYLECKCFLFCSKYEGFGIPIIEAALCGVPIIATNITSIPEILGNSGLLVDPTFEKISEGIQSFIETDGVNIPTDYSTLLQHFCDWKIPAQIVFEKMTNNY